MIPKTAATLFYSTGVADLLKKLPDKILKGISVETARERYNRSPFPLIETKGIPTVVTAFDKWFQALPLDEKFKVEAEYDPLNAQDWRTLTLEQKRARTRAPLTVPWV